MQNLIKIQPTATQWVNQLSSKSALLDNQLNLIDASQEWFKTFHFDRDKVLGKPFLELFSRFNETWQDTFEYALEGLTDIDIMDKFKSETGLENHLIWNINPWRDGYGKVVGIIMHVKGISEKTAIELELKGNKRLSVEKGSFDKIGSWEYNIEDDEMYWSKELYELLAINKDIKPTYKRTILLFQPGKDRRTIKKLIDDAINSRKPWNKNLELKTKKGETIWINTIGRPKFKEGECVRIIGTIQNINNTFIPEVKKIALQKKPDTWNKIEELHIGFASIDIETGRITKMNRALISLMGLPKRIFLNKHFKEFLSVTTKEIVQLKNSIRVNNSISGFEKEVFLVGLKFRTVLRFSGEIYTTAKNTRELIISCENISKYCIKEVRLNEELTEANAELNRLTHFTHMVSHNLRAHATNFDLLLNFLNNEQDISECKKLLKIIFQSTENLTTTIKGLRELVEIRHQINKEKKQVVLNEFVYRTIQNSNGLIKKRNVKIHNEIPDDYIVSALPIYLENIIFSLLNNAIKFKNNNRQPVIILKTETTKLYHVFTIEDNGLGIDLSRDDSKLFQLYRTPKHMDESSGMGLYLVKYQIEIMGGRIYVESQVGKGSIFKVYFPMC